MRGESERGSTWSPGEKNVPIRALKMSFCFRSHGRVNVKLGAMGGGGNVGRYKAVNKAQVLPPQRPASGFLSEKGRMWALGLGG